MRRLVLGDGDNLGSRMLRSVMDEVESVTLVQECRELEEGYGTKYTDDVLMAGEGESVHSQAMKEEIMKRDREARLSLYGSGKMFNVASYVATLDVYGNIGNYSC